MPNFINVRTLLVCFCISVWTGCGGEDSGGSNAGAQQFAPLTQAELTDLNNVYTVSLPGQGSVTLRFPSSGRYQLTSASGSTINGTISNLQKNGNVWTANLTPDANSQGASSGALTLTWTAENSGTFIFQPLAGPTENGTFTVTRFSQGNGGTSSGSGAGTTSGNAAAGSGLAGKTLELTYTSPGGPSANGERFFFSSENDASFGNGADTATYVYDKDNGQLMVRRSGGQTYRLILTPGSSAGTTVVLYQQPGGNPSNTQASYTLR